MNGLPRELPELLAVIGVLYFGEWAKESASHALVLFRAAKAKESAGEWILSDVQNLVIFICDTENEVIEKQSTSNIDYAKIFKNRRSCLLENIVELWQVKYLIENQIEIFNGAKRFYKKICSPHTDDQAREGMELKLIEILSTAERRYRGKKNSPNSLKLNPPKVMMRVYQSFRSIASRSKCHDLSHSRNDAPRIGLGVQSSYKRNSLGKEVTVDANTKGKVPAPGHHLYTAGWSAEGHFVSDENK